MAQDVAHAVPIQRAGGVVALITLLSSALETVQESVTGCVCARCALIVDDGDDGDVRRSALVNLSREQSCMQQILDNDGTMHACTRIRNLTITCAPRHASYRASARSTSTIDAHSGAEARRHAVGERGLLQRDRARRCV
jgi:hypothetical protein